MARNRQWQFRHANAISVVGYLHKYRAATCQFHLDSTRTAVHRVFQQFLESSGGSFDDLARRDLIDQMIGKSLYLSWFSDSRNPLKCPNWRGLWQNRGHKTCVATLGGKKSN